MKILVVLLAAVWVSAQQQAPPTPVKPGAIRGRIVVAETGRPLARARVGLVSASAPGRPLLASSSNALGNFELRDVPPACSLHRVPATSSCSTATAAARARHGRHRSRW